MKNGRYEEGERAIWYQNGKRHREDGPVRHWESGLKEWAAKTRLNQAGFMEKKLIDL